MAGCVEFSKLTAGVVDVRVSPLCLDVSIVLREPCSFVFASFSQLEGAPMW